MDHTVEDSEKRPPDPAAPGRDLRDTFRFILSGTLGSFVLKLSATGLSFLTTLLLARVLGLSGYGIYAYAMAWITFLSIPSLLGLDRLIVREVSVYRDGGQWGRMRRFLGQVQRTALVSATLLGLGAVGLFWVLNETGAFPEKTSQPLMLSMLALPLLVWMRLRQSTLQGLEHITRGQVAEFILRPGLLFLTVLVIVVGSLLELEASTAIALYLATAFLALLMGEMIYHRALPLELRLATAEPASGSILRAAAPLLLVAVLQSVNAQTDILLLGLFRNTEEAGVYSIARRGTELVSFVLIASNTALAPAIAQLHARGEKDALARLLSRATSWVTLAALGVATPLVVFGNWFLLIFGEQFTAGIDVLRILTLAMLFNVALGPVNLLLVMTGHGWSAARGVAVGALVNVVLCLILIPRYGDVGSAIASATSMILWNILLAIEVRRRLGVASSFLGSWLRG